MVKFPTRRSLLTAGTGGSLAAVAAAFLLRGRPGEPVPEPSSTQPAASASGTGSLRTDLTAHSSTTRPERPVQPLPARGGELRA